MRKQTKATFAQALVHWQQRHGRHDLPWQNTQDPYRVWLSEVMLQQTQVATVRAYFDRFLRRFPTLRALAEAPLDDVLALWSGLGYYSRARHLHRCAQQVVAEYGGRFPQAAAVLQRLPGIGASTAAAVASICFGERVSILDGNVKRVLTRYLAFADDLARAASERALRAQAVALLPDADLQQTMPIYTQALMDLGATLCTPKRPQCVVCPLQQNCRAAQLACAEKFPVKSRQLKRRAEAIWLLWAQTPAGAVWLAKRPTPGVWAGLYCFALFASRSDLLAALPAESAAEVLDLPAFKHVLTHKELHLHPVHVVLLPDQAASSAGQWFGAAQWPALGLPAPVRRLLTEPGHGVRGAG